MSLCRTALLVASWLLALVGFGCEPQARESSSSARTELAGALVGLRSIEGRLTGGFTHAAYNPKARLPSQKLRKIIRKIESAGNSSQALADGAVIDLIGGEPARAVSKMERALESGPRTATLLSDLAAAHLALAQNGQPESLVEALELAEQAVALDSKLPEARFNRALALQYLFLAGQARLAWDDYARIDPASNWTEEARKRSRALRGPSASQIWEFEKEKLDEAALQANVDKVDRIVGRFPQASREYAEEKLLGDWAEAWLAKRTGKAERSLTIARAIGAALVKRNGDRMVADVLATIESAEKESGGRLALLAEGHRWYQEGLSRYPTNLSHAERSFRQAQNLLSRAKSPFTFWATFRLAVCDMQHHHYLQALDHLDQLRFGDAGRTFQNLAGRSHWVAGLIHGIKARPTESLAAYRLAGSIFETLGENENRAIVSALTAEGLRNSGNSKGAWPHHLASLRSLSALRVPARCQMVLEGSGFTALAAGQTLAALNFQQEALGALSLSENQPSRIYGLLRRALIEIKVGRFEKAERDLAEARKRLDQVADEAHRESLLADILSAEGQIPRAGSPDQTIEKLSSAIQIYEKTQYQQQLAILYASRARAQLDVGRPDLAETDFARAIQAIGRKQEEIQDRVLRTAFTEESRSIFEEMVSLQARRGRKEQALDYAEIGRVQLFRQQTSGRARELPKIPVTAEISRKMPHNTALIEYLVLDRQLLAWVVRQESVAFFAQDIPRKSLAWQIEQFRYEVQEKPDDSRANNVSRELFDLLIGNFASALQGIDKLILVPDRELYSVPFAALLDPAGRYLLEHYTLSVSPSAGLYLQALADRKTKESSRDILVIGDPALDQANLSLPRLVKAKEEAMQIAALYPQANVLLGREATKQRFLEALGKYRIVHFAGHAVANPADPLTSFLALAPSSEGDSGILYARELHDRPGMATKLVVLSACNTTFGNTYEGEGVAGLARPFLALGVPSVIGSLWPVDDEATMTLSVELHRQLRKWPNTSDALRQAQLSLISKSNPLFSTPASWAGFQIIGAGT